MKYNPRTIIIAIIVFILLIGVICYVLNRKPATESLFPLLTPRPLMKKGEIVLYYTSWCGHSNMFMPEWTKFENIARVQFPQLLVRKIQCEDGNEAICMQKGIEGYPTVVFHINDVDIPFTGNRSADGLIEFVKKNL